MVAFIELDDLAFRVPGFYCNLILAADLSCRALSDLS
jgi:hypothetical protein